MDYNNLVSQALLGNTAFQNVTTTIKSTGLFTYKFNYKDFPENRMLFEEIIKADSIQEAFDKFKSKYPNKTLVYIQLNNL